MDRSDIELSDEIVEVRRSRKPGIVLSVRLSAEESDALQHIANERGLTLSQVGGDAVRAYLQQTVNA